jgi:hypothetical protein
MTRLESQYLAVDYGNLGGDFSVSLSSRASGDPLHLYLNGGRTYTFQVMYVIVRSRLICM